MVEKLMNRFWLSLKKVALKILFGKRVRELRENRGKTQEQMAFELGTSLRQYGRIERGEVNTGRDTISEQGNCKWSSRGTAKTIYIGFGCALPGSRPIGCYFEG